MLSRSRGILPSRYVYLRVPWSVQQPSAAPGKYAFYSTCSFCLCHLYPTPSRNSLVFIRLVFVFFVALIPMTMETRCSKVIFPNYSKKKPAEDTLVPPLWGTRGKMFVFLGLFVHAAVRGGTCAFTLKIVTR